MDDNHCDEFPDQKFAGSGGHNSQASFAGVENLHHQPVLNVHQSAYEPDPTDHGELRSAALGGDTDEWVATGEVEGRGLAPGGGGGGRSMKNHGFFTKETLAEKEDWVTTDLHVLQTAPSRTMERRERQERMSSVRLEPKLQSSDVVAN
ncbi:hypothetical protein MRB53_022073 [Persea americana]|uniref:Uncharacterized protein n=1 Tax=Persea americana TaxID=3435 RepID=A0ACC2L5Y0_PERAE|nr:hypothetical protein MRB53_022073 [Persea americana]